MLKRYIILMENVVAKKTSIKVDTSKTSSANVKDKIVVYPEDRVSEVFSLMDKILHKHHVIPKHAGGTDDPENIIMLTIEEHAEAHKLLFEEYGRWQDRKQSEKAKGFLRDSNGKFVKKTSVTIDFT